MRKDVSLVKGNIFIYPTDTIYGIGCNAQNEELVIKIREIKGRPTNPFSIIAPSKEWIKTNLELKPEHEEYLDKLPGPFTLIIKIKNKDCVAKETIPETDCLGVRIPDHWFASIATDLNIPIITTSVNEAGEPAITNLDQIPENIKNKVHFAIDESTLDNNPSTIINLTGDKPEIIER